jgi:hypothetical protein
MPDTHRTGLFGLPQVLWPTEEPPVANDPEEIAETLCELARLDLGALGQQAVLERLDQVAAVELLRLQAQIEDQPIRAVAERLLARPRR